MGNDTAEVAEALPSSCGIKVHHLMCQELMKFVGRISQIFPDIESVQPRCRSGIDALCSLNVALEKAKLLIQHCTESSKLYLAITGDAIMLRCERVTNAFGQSLIQIQNMVPLLLAARISAIVDDLKDAKFIMESPEEEAGKVVLALLRQASDSAEASEFEAFRIAALRLHITSSKDVLIEKRSIKKLLDKVRDTDQTKERILKYLLYLLRKYGNSNRGEQTVNFSAQGEDPRISTNSACKNAACSESIEPELRVGFVRCEVQTDVSSKPIPPDEFRCPISLKLMHDPVVIASGQTFERVWIEKWFSEGHDTCPKTQKKLSHFSITPNSALKDLISKWCKKNGINIPDPCSQPIPKEVYSWNMSCSSIASFGSSLNNVPLRGDDSSVSIGSSDVSLVGSQIIVDGSNLGSLQKDNYSDSSQSLLELSHDKNSGFLSELGGLPWESQCKVMEDVKDHLKDNEHPIVRRSFVQSLVRFLKDACDRYDVKAQRLGTQVLLLFVSKTRNEIPALCEDVLHLLVYFLDSEITEEALAVIQVLSGDPSCISEVVACGALPSILKILESPNREVQVPAFKILCNLSSHSNTGSQIVHLGYIPKLILLLGDSLLAGHCMRILKNLCSTEEGRSAVAEAKDCIASFAELLENGNHEEQEHAVAILFSLCSHRIKYCELVLKEGVIPSLVTISINGNSKGREIARELLRLLRDINWSDSQSSPPPIGSNLDLPCKSDNYSIEKQSTSKAPGYFRRKIRLFSKPRSLTLY